MNLEQARCVYREISGIASTVARQASFAGIAIIWLFKIDTPEVISLPVALQLPSLLFIASLTFDLFQYSSSALLWGGLQRLREHQNGKDYDGDMMVPIWINCPAVTFFWLKLIAVVGGYIALIIHLLDTISFV